MGALWPLKGRGCNLVVLGRELARARLFHSGDFSSRTKTRILDRFHNSNLSVCNTNGVLPFELKAGESASFDGKLARTFDDIFSAELAAMSTDHN